MGEGSQEVNQLGGGNDNSKKSLVLDLTNGDEDGSSDSISEGGGKKGGKGKSVKKRKRSKGVKEATTSGNLDDSQMDDHAMMKNRVLYAGLFEDDHTLKDTLGW
ncbi:uncharacterized protein MELLADRAFT_110321 [Melampsora larici-populina 98AG31]|uniref:Uncharacterized protein n=1 Tax=Melampsora larici-populina (strain 98AG31 / pathotype 3-4-7) TaxID=747676 RepID=F4RZD7_MELLP|nr:uncharacterized protein MELLADRAFT_110321 [Melampsora larici-populina 98AG31]EGG02273.1 hypothetical protein MELLADRAFT_110321 [Melampsora larici-populina 98AG31]